MKKRFITTIFVCLILGFALAGHAAIIYETTFDDVTELINWNGNDCIWNFEVINSALS